MLRFLSSFLVVCLNKNSRILIALFCKLYKTKTKKECKISASNFCLNTWHKVVYTRELIYNCLQEILFKKLECNCQSWCDAFVRRTRRSKRCCGTLVLSVSDNYKTRRNGIAAGMHLRLKQPERKTNLNFNKCKLFLIFLY